MIRKVRFDSKLVRLDFAIEGENFSALVEQGKLSYGQVKQGLKMPVDSLSLTCGRKRLSENSRLSKPKK
jgi:hypothetical protein